MRPGGVVRRTGAAWFLPTIFLVTLVGALTELEWMSHYFVGDVVDASFYSTILVSPLAAVYAAFRTSGFADAARGLRPVRPAFGIAASTWWPLLIGVPVAFALGLMASIRNAPHDLKGWALLLVLMGAVTTAMVVGVVVGQLLPVVIAVPTAFAVTYGWQLLPAAIGSPLLSQVDGTFNGCCSNEMTPTWTSMGASVTLQLVLLLGLAVILTLVMHGRRWMAMATIPLITLIALTASFGVAQSSSRPLTLTPTAARTTTQVCEEADGLTVCVWPENESRLGDTMRMATELNGAMRVARLPEVRQLSEGDAHNAVSFNAAAYLAPEDRHLSVASGYAFHVHKCLTGQDVPPTSAVAAIALMAGVDSSRVENTADPKSLNRARTAVQDGTVAKLLGPIEEWPRSGCGDA